MRGPGGLRVWRVSVSGLGQGDNIRGLLPVSGLDLPPGTKQLMSPIHIMTQVNGEMCGGHGVCECGACKCEPGWTGDTCSCR